MNDTTEKGKGAKAPAHTAEPWDVQQGVEVHELTDLDGCAVIADCAVDCAAAFPKGTQRANAERIVVCVNACAGIADPATAIPELVNACELALASILKHIRPDQFAPRDLLRAALKGIGR